MRNIFFNWLALSLLCAFGLHAQIYVSPSGNDANAGTMISPKATIAAGIGAATAGQTVFIDAGTYTISSIITINKAVTLLGNGGLPNTRPLLVMSAATVKTILVVSSPNVTIDNLHIQVLGSGGGNAAGNGNHGIFVANPTISKSYDNLVIQNNFIENISSNSIFTPTSFNSYGIRLSAEHPNYSSGDNKVTIVNNTIFSQPTGRAPFGRGIRSIGNYGVIARNTFQTDYAMQIANINGGNFRIDSNSVTVSTNNPSFEINVPEFNNGVHSIKGNIFTRVSFTPFAMIEIKDNGNLPNINSMIVISDNVFNNINGFGVFCGRSSNITIENNVFNPLNGATNYNLIHVNTKHRTTNPVAVTPARDAKNIIIRKNRFNGTGNVGTAIQFGNHFSHPDSVGFKNIVIGGTSINDTNSFAQTIGRFISLDPQAVQSNTVSPALWAGLTISTTKAVKVNFDARFNTYNIGAGQQLPTNMIGAQLMSLENKISHGIDHDSLGFVRVKEKNMFVTTASFISPFMSARIKRATDRIIADDDTLNVQSGTYTQDALPPTTTFNTHFRAIGGTVTSVGWRMNGVGKTLNLLSDLSISGDVIFINGNIQTNANTLIFTPSANDPSANPAVNGEKNSSYIIGKAQTVRNIGTGASDFLGLNLPAGLDLGTLTLVRTSGPSGIIVAGPYSSIAAKWTISPSITANGRDNVEFRWLPVINNSKDANTLSAWRFDVVSSLWEKKSVDFVASATSPLVVSVPFDITQFSDWTISDNPNPLPLMWLSVHAQMRPNGNGYVSWKTIEEKNTVYFVVERSNDGKIFERIGETKANNMLKTNEYGFEDVSLKTNNSQNIYYRIKQIDQDNLFSYSNVVKLVSNSNYKQGFQVYPNPNNGSFTIKFDEEFAGNPIMIKIYDVHGKVVLDKTYTGSTTSELQFDHALSTGIYMCLLNNNVSQNVVRIVVK